MKLKIPNSFTLLFYVAIVVTISTYFIPAGEYKEIMDPKLNIEFVDPNSFQFLPSNPISIFGFFESFPKGMIEASEIIVYILIIGGSFRIIQESEISSLFTKFLSEQKHEKRKLYIIILMLLFSVLGTVFGTVEEFLPLYPLIIIYMKKLGYDKLTGASIVLLGSSAGFLSGVLNPFTTGIAQQIVKLPQFSGISFRIIVFILFVSISIYFVCLHANRIYKEPTYLNDDKKIRNIQIKREFILTIITILIGVIFIIFKTFSKNFGIVQVSTVFLIMGIVCGKINHMSSGKIVTIFIKGASALISGALIIGVARSITVIMESSNILDSIIYYLSSTIDGSNKYVDLSIMYLIQNLINIFIPSATGQAAVTMPIMGPLSDMSDITRQSAVLAYQLGDGITNIISPTSTYFISALAISNINWKDWAKFVFPLFITWILLGWILVLLSCFINLGPF